MGGCHVAAKGEQDKGIANTMSERKRQGGGLCGYLHRKTLPFRCRDYILAQEDVVDSFEH